MSGLELGSCGEPGQLPGWAPLIGCGVSVPFSPLLPFPRGFFFNHIFGCWVTSVCHGFSSQMAPFLVSASGKTYVGFLHSSSQGRDSNQLYLFLYAKTHVIVQTMEWPPWGGGPSHTPISDGSRSRAGCLSHIAPWAFPPSSAQAVPREGQERLRPPGAKPGRAQCWSRLALAWKCCYIFKNFVNHLFIHGQFEIGHNRSID